MTDEEHTIPPWYRQRFADEARRRPGWDRVQALDNLYLRQYHDSHNAVFTADQAWGALPPAVQFATWQQRGQHAAPAELTPWEQRAAAHEAHQRAQILLLGGVRQGAHLPPTYVEVETVPAAYQATIGGAYEYRVWSHEQIGGGISRDVPQPRGVAHDVTTLRNVVGQAPIHPPNYRVAVFTEDHALRAALQEHGVLLGQRYSAELGQERRQFYTQEAKQAVAVAREAVQKIEAVWQTYSPAQQRRAYLDAGQGTEPTLWEQRLAAYERLDRRQRMIPQASVDGELPAAFIEVEHGHPGGAPYTVRRWTRVWDTDLDLMRYQHQGARPAQHIAQIADLLESQEVPIFAAERRLRSALQQRGLAVAAEAHLAAQRPYLARDCGREYEIGE